MPGPRLAAAVTVALVVLWGCANPTESIIDRRALARARALWQAQSITDYSIEARELCFCAPGLAQWMEITVRGGVVVSSRPVEFVPVTASGPRRTVEQMFDFIAADHGDDPRLHVDLEYDPVLGYPHSITLRMDNPPPDFGLSIEARNLKRL